MLTAHVPAVPGSPFGEPGGPSLAPEHGRLLACVTISALVIAVGIATIRISLPLDFSRLIPAVLDVTLRDDVRPEPESEPRTERALDSTTEPGAANPPETLPTEQALPPAAIPADPARLPAAESRSGSVDPTDATQPVDWYGVLERAASETVDRYAAIDSLHPEFDELRRIAAERYAPVKPGPRPMQESVEKDIYGRTLLRRGNCFQVLDDTNVGNRYAFETFERHLWQCSISFGRKRGQNLPWVEPIRARYNHLRDPDGSSSVPAGREQ